jgi:hypothetical protein
MKHFPIVPANFMRNLALFLFSALLLAGCGTVVSCKSNAPAGPVRPPGYPIPVYTDGMTVPRPCEVIGTVSVKNSGFTVTGGTVEDVMKDVMRRARQNGADAVQMTSIDKPDFENPNYRVTADLLRYKDSWETIAISENEFLAYLRQNKKSLDPIEGVWFEDGQFENRIGIMRNTARPGRNFVGFVLAGEPPSWREGCKVMDIARGKQPGSYNLVFYLDDFSRVATTVVLGNAAEFSILIQSADEDRPAVKDFLKK